MTKSIEMSKALAQPSAIAEMTKQLAQPSAIAEMTKQLYQPSAIAEMTKQLYQPSALAEMTKAMEMSNALTQPNAIDLTALTAHMQPHSSILDREFLTEQIRPQPQIIERPIHYKTTEPYMNTPNTQQAPKQKVFIVHGHDEVLRLKVDNFVRRLGLDPIILMDRANGGNTIINKLIKNGDVAYAIILYTPCDEGRKAKAIGALEEPVLNKRARQNVVFEHGYFIARLGMDKVAAIVDPSVEIQNDIQGVVYIGTNESWEMKLLQEFKEAGIECDANALYA
ncbi:hypothetical protein E2R68_02280 [Psychromonas sp. RZ22]|nr:hypothetical protein E2R68_02280 [Psychromonas sp. RZ22]